MQTNEKTGERCRNPVAWCAWPCVVALLIVGMAGLTMWRACSAYPFYMIWDMDAITAVDLVCVNSGLTPDNISHPDCGMYLLLSGASRLVQAFGWLPASTLTDLGGSLNPLACLADVTEFVRVASPVANMLAVLLAWTALVALWRPSRWLALAALAVLVSQQSLVYLSSMSRPATFCLLFWSASLALLATARRVRVLRWRVVLFILSAALGGMCFLTKIQSLLYVLALPLFMVVKSPSDAGANDTAAAVPGRRQALIGSVIGAVLFFGLLGFLCRLDMPDFHGFYATAYGSTTRLKLLCAATGGLLLLNTWYNLPRARRLPYPAFLYWYSLALPGLLLALPLCGLLAGDAAEGARYVLWVAKVSLMRQDYSGYTGIAGIVKKLVAEGVFLWPAFLAHAMAVVTAAVLWIRGKARRPADFFPLVALSGAAVLNLGLATRCALRDVVWMEFLPNVTTVGCLFYCAHMLRERRVIRCLLVGVVFLALFSFNLRASHRMVRRIDANYNVYGWDPLHWCRRFYSGRSQDVFHDIMFKRYGVTKAMGIQDMPPSVRAALRHALHHGQDEQWVRFVFPTLKADVRTIGVFAEGSPVWCSRPEWVLRDPDTAAPPPGSVVLDPFACVRRSTGLLHRHEVIEHSEWFNKLKRDGSTANVLAVLPRADTRVHLFVERDRVVSLAALDGIELEGIGAVWPCVTVWNGESDKMLHAVHITSYVEIPWSELGHDAFFVLESLCGR